jgi:dTDP-4-amino-4,6-dideoxygalactose transaminase
LSAPPRRLALPIRSQPVLPLEMVFGAAKALKPRPFPLDAPGTVLTYSGTAAAYQAFRALALAPGSTVLCPSYNCGHEIEPLLRLGLRVECYRVTQDLAIDLEDVASRLQRGPSALLVTHYFGFAQPLAALRDLCDRHGALLVEDCAHAFLSDNAEHTLGRVGDVAIYSLRKTLPIPNGGAVVFNRASMRLKGALSAPPRLTTWMKSLDLTTKAVLDRFSAERSPRDFARLLALLPLVAGGRVLKVMHPRAAVDCYNPDDDDYRFSVDIMSWSISKLSLSLLERIDWRDYAARRRRNYRQLAAALNGVAGRRPLVPVLPEHTCPLYLPLWVDRPEDLYDRLAARRIYADVLWQQEHPAVDWAAYPEARDLKRHVFALPVHQDVDAEQVDRIVGALRA